MADGAGDDEDAEVVALRVGGNHEEAVAVGPVVQRRTNQLLVVQERDRHAPAGNMVVERLPFHVVRFAGEVANEEHSLRQIGKAGVKRHMGIRPTVRGVAMNPIDHPHGGGEGRTGTGKPPVDPWGNLTKGYRTRNNKRTQTFIVSRRKK